ncbi:MAG: hypothetical protein LUH11_03725 [Candidatus Gastranaerophilales bacterium]|nr:hypothetical protein [Candidatus Gastranaerophilales bacterium]
MKNALEIIQFLSYSSNAEVSKVSSWSNIKPEALNGLNRAIRVLWNSKEWNFRREIKKYTLQSGKSKITIGKYLLAQNGVRINNNPLEYDKEVPFYEESKGTPEKFYIDNKGKLNLYPIADTSYSLILETFSNLPVLEADGITTKEIIDTATDTINISERLENLFIDCLDYFCNEILNGDLTDEEYQEAALRYSEVYKLLENADLGSLDNDNNKGFLMPWQL